MNLCMAHCACLVFGGLVVCRSCRPLEWERVALQAEQVHLADSQVAWVRRAVRSVTTGAAFRLDRHMLIDERALLFHVTFDTHLVTTR